MNAGPVSAPEPQRRADVLEAIRHALEEMSSSSAVIQTQDGDLGVVFFDESEAYIVKLESAGLMVLTDG